MLLYNNNYYNQFTQLTMEDQVYKDLMKVGLSEKESRVYIASIKLGKSSIQKISKLSKVNRATTYVLIDTLIERGLMTTVTEGKKRYFSVESPAKLSLLYEKERTELSQKEIALRYLLPQLTEIFENTRGGLHSKVKFYNGEQGLKAYREELIKSKDKKVYSMFNHEQVNKHVHIKYVNPKMTSEFIKRKVTKKINTDLFVSTKNIEQFKEAKQSSDPNLDITDISKLNYNEAVDVSLFDNKLFITSLEENLLTVTVQDNNISKSVKSIFTFIKSNINLK